MCKYIYKYNKKYMCKYIYKYTNMYIYIYLYVHNIHIGCAATQYSHTLVFFVWLLPSSPKREPREPLGRILGSLPLPSKNVAVPSSYLSNPTGEL